MQLNMQKKQLDREVPPTEGMAQFKKLLKRKPTDKGNRRAKKPQEVVTTNVGKKPTNVQVPPPLRHGAKKGLMTAQGLTPKKRPPLLHEDSCRAMGLLLSIIKADDYEYLGNHAIEAMGGQVSLAWLRYTTVPLHFHPSSIVLNFDCPLTFCRGC